MRVPLLLFILLPLAEIAGFIFVGSKIGIAATLGLTVLTTVAGLVLLRIQGAGILQKLRDASREGANPGRELIHGAMIVVAAFLLILPGFLTDIIGLLLFLPFIRDLAWSIAGPRTVVFTEEHHIYRRRQEPQPPKDARVIDLDNEDYRRDPERKSPWSSDPDNPR
ncbi:MAG TPA: membrane protein FxsA [Rhizobium sp.]|nr:membrane protein FxsA [Rhizobium sp.]